jgi:glutaminase
VPQRGLGLPCKSGVGGGIVAVVPDRLTLCVWSPALAPPATRLLGMKALDCSSRTGLSVGSTTCAQPR